MLRVAAFVALIALASATVYMSEDFNDKAWKSRWVAGTEWKDAAETGEFSWEAAPHADDESDKGIKTSEDARFYSLSAPLKKSLNNEGKDIIVAYSVHHTQNLDCGGAYIKLVKPGFEPESFGGDTEYGLMFGPDICGTGTRRVHNILNKNGENHLTTKTVPCETDQKPHLYALFLNADNTYTIKIDDVEKESGTLMDDFDILPPKQIKDPEASKPKDWVDSPTMPDPEDVKPEGYDDIPAQIPDPDAEEPEDWDEEDDGEWEAPLIDNPEYNGPWTPKMIKNPEYKGPWEHPMIDNPEYEEDDTLHAVCSPCSHVGFELWQVKSGTLFDDILVTDSEADYKKLVKSWQKKADAINANAEAAAEAEKKAAEEAKAAEEEDEEDEEDEDEHDEL